MVTVLRTRILVGSGCYVLLTAACLLLQVGLLSRAAAVDRSSNGVESVAASPAAEDLTADRAGGLRGVLMLATQWLSGPRAATWCTMGLLGTMELSIQQLVVASTVLSMFFPCIATFVVLAKELGARDTLKSAGLMLASALIVGTALNFIL